jgi:hypothetical protein
MNRLLFLLAILFVSPAFAFTPWFCAGNKLKDGFYHSGGYGYECKNGATKNVCEGREGVKVRINGVVKRCEGGAVVNLPVDRPGLRPDPEHCMDRNCLTWSGDSGGGSSGGGSSGGGSSSGGGLLEIVDISGQQPPKKDSSGGGSSGGSSDGIGPVGGWLSDDEADKQSKQKAREEKEKQDKEKKKDGGNVPDPSAPPGNSGGTFKGDSFGKKDLESAKRLMEALKEHQKRWADKWTAIADQANRIKSDLADQLATCDWYYTYSHAEYEKCVNSKIKDAAERSKALEEEIELLKRIQAVEEKALNEQIKELSPTSRLIVNAFSGFTIPDGSSSSKTTEKTGDDKNGTTKETETITEKTSDGGGNGGGVVNNYNTQTNNITTTNNQTINNEIVNKIQTRDYSGALNALNGSLQALSRDIEGQTNVLNNSLNLGFAGLSGKLGDLIAKVDKLDSGNGGGSGGSGGGGNVANGNGSAAKASGEGDGQSDLEAFCKKHPNTLTCAEFNGNMPEEGDFSGLIPKKEVSIGWKMEDFLKGSSAKCPAPMKFDTMLGVISLSWEGFCEFLRMVRGFVIMAASVTGIMIVLKGQ